MSALTCHLLLSLYRYSQCSNLQPLAAEVASFARLNGELSARIEVCDPPLLRLTQPDALRLGRLNGAESNSSKKSAGFGHRSQRKRTGEANGTLAMNMTAPHGYHSSGFFSRIVRGGEIAFNLSPCGWTLLSSELSRSVILLFKVTCFGGKLRRVQATV